MQKERTSICYRRSQEVYIKSTPKPGELTNIKVFYKITLRYSLNGANKTPALYRQVFTDYFFPFL